MFKLVAIFFVLLVLSFEGLLIKDQLQLKALVDKSIRTITTSFVKKLTEIHAMLLEAVGKKVHDPLISTTHKDNTQTTLDLPHRTPVLEFRWFHW